MAAGSIRPTSSVSSLVMTCSGEIELKVERLIRDPVTTISSSEAASSSVSSISSTPSSSSSCAQAVPADNAKAEAPAASMSRSPNGASSSSFFVVIATPVSAPTR